MLGRPEKVPGAGEASGEERAGTTSDQGLSRNQRLTTSSLFRETFDQGQKWVGRYMVLWLRRDPSASLRLGVVASRKVGNAVCRARAKRRLREAYRKNRRYFSGPVDVVLVARRPILQAAWSDIVEELLSLSRKAGLKTGECDA